MVRYVCFRTFEGDDEYMKCDQYWPSKEHTEKQFRGFSVCNTSTQTSDHFRETKLILRNTAVSIVSYVIVLLCCGD